MIIFEVPIFEAPFLLRKRSSEFWKYSTFFFFFFKGLLKSSYFNSFDHILSKNWLFTFQIWYDNFLIRFPDFFPEFPQILRFHWVWPYYFTELIDDLLLKSDMKIFLSVIIQGWQYLLARWKQSNFWHCVHASKKLFAFEYSYDISLLWPRKFFQQNLYHSIIYNKIT